MRFRVKDVLVQNIDLGIGIEEQIQVFQRFGHEEGFHAVLDVVWAVDVVERPVAVLGSAVALDALEDLPTPFLPWRDGRHREIVFSVTHPITSTRRVHHSPDKLDLPSRRSSSKMPVCVVAFVLCGRVVCMRGRVDENAEDNIQTIHWMFSGIECDGRNEIMNSDTMTHPTQPPNEQRQQ